MPRAEVVQQRSQNHSTVDENVPVHLCRRRRWRRWEERKDECDHKEGLRGNVDGETPFAQAELGWEEWLVRDAPPDHASDGAHVTRQQRRRRQGCDGVEGGGRTDVNQGQESRDDNGRDDSVQW